MYYAKSDRHTNGCNMCVYAFVNMYSDLVFKFKFEIKYGKAILPASNKISIVVIQEWFTLEPAHKVQHLALTLSQELNLTLTL